MVKAKGQKIQRTTPIATLRVCRQLYLECSQTLWETTFWSFKHPLAFAQFMLRHSEMQKRLMSKLYLDIIYNMWGKYEYGWYRAINQSMLKEYPALTTLLLDIRFAKRRIDHAYSVIDDSEGRMLSRTHSSEVTYQELSDLSSLPLRKVQISAFVVGLMVMVLMILTFRDLLTIPRTSLLLG
jgi:hypothetical protein